MPSAISLATLLGRRLYIDEMGTGGPWDPRRLPYQEESVVEVLVGKVGHRRVDSDAELQAILRESEKGLPAIRVWISEGPEEAAWAVWNSRSCN